MAVMVGQGRCVARVWGVSLARSGDGRKCARTGCSPAAQLLVEMGMCGAQGMHVPRCRSICPPAAHEIGLARPCARCSTAQTGQTDRGGYDIPAHRQLRSGLRADGVEIHGFIFGALSNRTGHCVPGPCLRTSACLCPRHVATTWNASVRVQRRVEGLLARGAARLSSSSARAVVFVVGFRTFVNATAPAARQRPLRLYVRRPACSVNRAGAAPRALRAHRSSRAGSLD